MIDEDDHQESHNGSSSPCSQPNGKLEDTGVACESVFSQVPPLFSNASFLNSMQFPSPFNFMNDKDLLASLPNVNFNNNNILKTSVASSLSETLRLLTTSATDRPIPGFLPQSQQQGDFDQNFVRSVQVRDIVCFTLQRFCSQC